jgi:hypothetical protein
MEKLFLILFLNLIFITSCKKEFSCEGCTTIADTINKPPIVFAGRDTTITIVLPDNSFLLDGSTSYDPDGQIVAYSWTAISGPAVSISNPQSAKTSIMGLTQAVYQFKLMVTDNGGVSAADTVAVTVNTAAAPDSCATDRSQENATLLPFGTLSQARKGMAVASAGNKIVFAGGQTASGVSNRVDILDLNTNQWSNATLSEARTNVATAVLGSKIFFAGGFFSSSNGYVLIKSGLIDIYDTQTDSWTSVQLGSIYGVTGRYGYGEQLFGAAANGKVVFASNGDYNAYIYDGTSNKWSISDALYPYDPLGGSPIYSGIAATAIGDKIYFAGSSWMDNSQTGLPSWVEGTIHIFNTQTNNWTTSHLQSEPRGWMAGIAVGNTNYWAGGFERPGGLNGVPSMSSNVEMRDMTTGQSTSACLFQPNAKFSAVQKNNSIIFFTGAGQRKDKFDIYNLDSKTWLIGVLPQSIESAAIISVNNTIYVAGGKVNGTLTSQVFKLTI